MHDLRLPELIRQPRLVARVNQTARTRLRLVRTKRIRIYDRICIPPPFRPIGLNKGGIDKVRIWIFWTPFVSVSAL